MSSNIPYLGSKISLISKAKIRYEGILYTIDPKESTVALAKVRSYGTEDRPTDRPVAPRDEIFEYIIFRGSDIEDLHVCEPPKAQQTLQQSLPPQDPAILKSSESVVSHASSLPSSQPAQTTQTYQPFGGQQPFQQFSSQPAAPISTQTSASFAAAAAHQQHQQAGNTTRPKSRSPTTDAGVQTTPSKGTANSPPPARNMVPSSDQNQARYQYRRQQNQEYHSQQHSDRGFRSHPHMRGSRPPRGGSTGFRPPRGVSRGRGGNRGGASGRKIEFEGEFDFETANAQFDKDEFEKELKQKLTISDKPINGEKEEGSDHENDDNDSEEAEIYYDKAKSFFDNISCEASERAKGSNTKPNWREERKLNTETFGTGGNFHRGGRGGFRGNYRGGGQRGGYYNNRGRGRGYRGRGGNSRGGRPRSGGWVDYEYDYAAAGLDRSNLNERTAAARS